MQKFARTTGLCEQDSRNLRIPISRCCHAEHLIHYSSLASRAVLPTAARVAGEGPRGLVRQGFNRHPRRMIEATHDGLPCSTQASGRWIPGVKAFMLVSSMLALALAHTPAAPVSAGLLQADAAAASVIVSRTRQALSLADQLRGRPCMQRAWGRRVLTLHLRTSAALLEGQEAGALPAHADLAAELEVSRSRGTAGAAAAAAAAGAGTGPAGSMRSTANPKSSAGGGHGIRSDSPEGGSSSEDGSSSGDGISDDGSSVDAVFLWVSFPCRAATRHCASRRCSTVLCVWIQSAASHGHAICPRGKP